MEYLDFELPVKELQEQIAKCQAIGNESSVDVTETCKLLTDKLETAMRVSMAILLLGKRFNCLAIPLDHMHWITSMPFLAIVFWSYMVIEILQMTKQW